MIKDYHELMGLFMQAGAIMDHYMQQNRRGAFAGPHMGQGRVMALLNLAPEMSQKELVYLLGISKQALGELLAKLENCEYIERHPSDDDRRVMMVTLTEKGKQAAEEMNQDEGSPEEIFACLTEEEQDNLKNYLERLVDANLTLLPPRHRPPRPEEFGGRPPHPGEFGGRPPHPGDLFC